MSPLSAITPQPHPITVVIADDSDMARESLRCMLGELPELTFLGEACTGTEIIRLCEQTRPQVALIDIRMPDIDGLEVTRVLSRVAPTSRVIILTMMSQPAFMIEALRAGARGYLLKDLSLDELATAIRSVHNGEIYLNPELATATLRHIVGMTIAPVTLSPSRPAL
jgi:NarL family two-component system response regulator LiaR